MKKTNGNKDILMKMTFKRLLTIQVISSLSGFIGPLIDGIVVSNFMGEECMAAFGIITPTTIIAAAFSNIFNSGSQNLAGKYLGQGKTDKLNELISNTLAWAAITGIVLTAAFLLFSEQLLTLLGATEDNIDICAAYIRAYSIGITPTIMLPSLIGFLQLDNAGKVAVSASAALTITDVIFDLLAVLVFKNGMGGIGFATSVSYMVAFIIAFLRIAGKKSTFTLSAKCIAFKNTKSIISLGIPAATFLICNAIRLSITNNIILDTSGTTAVAAFSIQNTLRPITLCLTLGTGITSLLICSVISGEENRASLKNELSYILKLGLTLASCATIVFLAISKYPLAWLFCIGKSEEFLSLVTLVLRMYIISIPFCMINSIFIHYFQSIHKLLLSTTITFLENVAFYIATAKIMSPILGTNGIWIAYVSAEVLTLLALLVYVTIKNKHFPKCLDDFLMLDDDFGVPDEDRMNITASSQNEIIGISEDIVAFCKSHDMSPKSSMAAGLCTEELAIIALNNASSSKLTYVDIYMTYKNGRLTIRLQDNSIPFDKKLLAGIPDKNDPCANVGIRIVKGLTEEMSYRIVLGMNVFTVKL